MHVSSTFLQNNFDTPVPHTPGTLKFTESKSSRYNPEATPQNSGRHSNPPKGVAMKKLLIALCLAVGFASPSFAAD